MFLSLTCVARLSKGNIRGGVRGLHGPSGQDAGAAVNSVPNFDGDLRVPWKPDVHTRAEADEADALAAVDGFSSFFPGDDAAGDKAGDLFELDVAPDGG